MWPGGFITQEMIEAAMAAQKAKVAALTPEQRAWLSAEEDWKHTQARIAEQSKHNLARELDQLLADDIKEFGCPNS